MNCSCIRNNNYDFVIEHTSCDSLIYTDLSEWMTEDHYTIPVNYIITITPPNSNSVDVLVKAFGATKIDSLQLYGESGLAIQDGIYCFKINNCQDIITKYKAITCKLNCRRDNLILKAEDEASWKQVQKVDSYISAIHSHASFGNFSDANYTYKICKNLLDNLNCDC